MNATNDFLQGEWQGRYTAKTSAGTFHDKVDLQLFGERFEITYYDGEAIRSAAKGRFLISANKISFHSEAERLGASQWNHVASKFDFAFNRDGDNIHLQATDHFGVEKIIHLCRQG